jgi:hypothetical protein
MHADRPGDRARLLYWYRTAPGIGLGRSPLDEDAIRTIEEQHPDIDFDWPAILALAAVMTPEDEAPARAAQQQRQGRRQRGRDQKPPQSPSASAREQSGELGRDDRVDEPSEAVGLPVSEEAAEEAAAGTESLARIEIPPPRNLLLEELAGREIGSRLRARHAEIVARIDDLDVDGSVKDAWFKRAEAIDPELWMTPEEVLDGVRNADAHYEKLRAELAAP